MAYCQFLSQDYGGGGEGRVGLALKADRELRCFDKAMRIVTY